MDPLAERGPQYSPYVYTFNNPLKYTDPDGRWPLPTYSGALALANKGRKILKTLFGYTSEGSTAASVTQTATSKSFDGLKGVKAEGINKVAKKAAPILGVVTAAKALHDMDPSDPASVQTTNEILIKETAGAIPVAGPFVQRLMADGLDPEGITNLDNDKLSNAYSTGISTTENMTNAFKKKIDAQAYSRDTMQQGAAKRAEAKPSNGPNSNLFPKINKNGNIE